MRSTPRNATRGEAQCAHTPQWHPLKPKAERGYQPRLNRCGSTEHNALDAIQADKMQEQTTQQAQRQVHAHTGGNRTEQHITEQNRPDRNRKEQKRDEQTSTETARAEQREPNRTKANRPEQKNRQEGGEAGQNRTNHNQTAKPQRCSH